MPGSAPKPGPRPGPGPNRSRLITAVVGVGVLVLLGWLLVRLLSPSTPAIPEAQLRAMVTEFCTDLGKGQAKAAWQEFSSAYRSTTEPAAFDRSLLGSDQSATCVSRSLNAPADQATLSLRRAHGGRETAHLTMAQESGKWRINAMTVTDDGKDG